MAYGALLAKALSGGAAPGGPTLGAPPAAMGLGAGTPPAMPGLPPPPTGAGAMPTGAGAAGSDPKSVASAAVAALNDLRGAFPSMGPQIDQMVNSIVAQTKVPGGAKAGANANVSIGDALKPPPATTESATPLSTE